MPEIPRLTVSEFIETCNQILDYSFSGVTIIGEVSNFKINQNKWVFFDLKDENSTLNCFMSVFQLHMPLEDGMKVVVRGVPKMTKWGKFSFTVQSILPVGEGSIKKTYELLKAKLEKEGLFDPTKKRPLPSNLSKIGVISSVDAAGYADFIKILNERWGGFDIVVAHTQVQGLDAPDQIIRALEYFNKHSDVEIIVIVRGGGSADDLSCFNNENLVRTIAASKIPVVTGIGHEINETLSDLAADLCGSTPSNVAEMISHDRKQKIEYIHSLVLRAGAIASNRTNDLVNRAIDQIESIKRAIISKIEADLKTNSEKQRILNALNPEKILQQGYAILKGNLSPGNVVKITTYKNNIIAEVKNVEERSNK